MNDNSIEVYNTKTPHIYKSTKLNHANFGDFSHTDYQVYLHLISKIGGVDKVGKYLQTSQLERSCILTASEFSDIFGAAPTHCYTALKKAVNRLMKTDVRVQELGERNYCRINICSKAEYKKDEGKICIKFTDDIMPYLAQVKERFLLYNLKEISNFKSLYTTRLYELIQEFKETGWMLKSIEQLRESFAVQNKFKLYADFKRKTFAHACDEINKNYPFNLRFEEIKKGRKVVAVKFFFRQIKVHQVTNQKTGVTRNIYEKPTPPKPTKRKYTRRTPVNKKTNSTPETLTEISNKPKSLKGILSSLLPSYFNKKK